MKYILGLDLGVASIGWAVTEINDKGEPISLIDANSVIFSALDNNDKGKLYNVERRDKRGARRVLRRRVHRLERTKNLILSKSFLTKEELDNLYKGKLENIYEIRYRGLKEQLTKNEIARLMIFYCKNRGFKSNRKTDEIELLESLKKGFSKNDSDEKKLKPIIAKNTKRIEEEGLTPIEVIFLTREEDKSILGFKNKEGNYKFGFKRNQIIDEAKKILSNQKLISEELVNLYIEILSSQRDFSDGPGGDSKYKVDFRTLAGKCKYTGEIRGVKSAPSYEIFTMLQKLNDVRYIDSDSNDKREKKRLNKEEINKIYDLVLNKNKKLTYELIEENISSKNIKILDIPQLDKLEYKKIREKFFKNKENEEINEDEISKFNEKLNKKRLEKELVKNNLSVFKKLTNDFNENGIGENRINELGGIEFLDLVTELLTYAKTDTKMEYYINNNERYSVFKEAKDVVEVMKGFPNYTRNGNLSLSLVKKLNEKMLDGYDYEGALSSLGYYIDTNINWKKFPTVLEIEDKLNTKITNPNVKHVLVILRKLYNTLLFKYGKPQKVHLELARDFANDFSSRNKIRNEQLENKLKKESANFEIYGENNELFEGKKNLSNDDYTRIKLWKEQNKKCMYSGKIIEKEKLLTSEVQVDHILPYSKSQNNSYSNKVLVLSKENQDKRERTPYQWLKGTEKWNEFKRRVEMNLNISNKKKENLLFKDEIVVNDFLERELHATSYSSRLALMIFQRLIPASDEDKYDENGNEKVKYIYNRNVIAFNGKMTSRLRNLYSLNKITHNFESGNLEIDNKLYYLKEFKIDKNSLTISAYNKKTGVEINSVVKVDKIKTLTDEILQKELLKTVNLKEISDKFKEKILFDFDMIDFQNLENVEYEISSLIYKMIMELKEQVYIKNRENHLHHALDAFLLTIMNKSMQIKLTNFDKLISSLKNRTDEILVEETGEYISSREYADMLKKQKLIDLDENEKGINFIINGKKQKLSITKPYPEFINDIKFKIFDKRENPKLPYHVVKSKTKGALHAETILGESKGQITKRVSVFALKEKGAEEIFDKDGSQKEIYETIIKWQASKSKEYPRLKNGNIIKKVKIVDENKDKLIKLGEKRYVEMGQTIVRILVFEKEGEKGLRFASLGRYNYNKLKRNEDFEIQVWKSQSKKGVDKIKYSSLKENGYKLKLELIPNEHIEIELDKGQRSECLVNGFSSGKLEVDSIIGDKLELLENNISKTKTIKDRYQITVSTIKSIKKIKKNILGD